MRKGKILTGVIAIISIVLLAVVGIVNASNAKSYLVEIIDDGSSNLNGNDQTEITKKIIQDNSSNIVYEVSLKNKIQATSSKEVTMFIDTSKSTGINDPEKNVKAKAASLAEALYDNVSGIKITVADSNSIKLSSSTDKTAIIDAINNLEVQDGDAVDESIVRAADSFSSDSSSAKTMIIFTDATDTMKEVKSIQNKGISVISILDNMTRQSYEQDGESTIGITYMVDNIDTDNIVNSLNKSLSKFVIKDEFTDEILNYFDFSVVSKGETDTVTKTENGYIWNISELQANTSATLQFKLTLKDSSRINAIDAYKNINTSKNMNVQYEDLGATKSYDVAESPIVLLCEKYSLTVQAVSEENKDLPVDGISVKVTATKEDGKVVYDNTLTTDEDGKVLIDNLKTLGKLTFTVIPQVDKTGYQASPSITFSTYNEETGKVLSVTTEGIDSTVDNTKRNISVKLPISTQKFSLEVNVLEENNAGVTIGNTELRLIQPTLNSKYELTALYGTTASNGKVVFAPSVMPKAGTYDYILSQTSEKTGYESFGNVTLRITFDDTGKVTKIEKKYNNKVEANRISDTYAIVNVYNVNKSTNNFDFEIELSNKINNKSKIEGATYNIEVSTEEEGTVTYSNQRTDENGKINLRLSGSGYIQIKVKEVSPKLGYYKDDVEKELIVYRKDGKLQYIARAVPADLDVTANASENKVKLNLTSEMNANPSAIQIQLADIEENDIFIPGISVKLKGMMTNEEYTGTTDSEGKVTFLVQPQDAGTYQYKVELDNSTIPSNYSAVDGDILLSVNYSDDREINDSSDIKGPFFDCKAIEYTEDNFTYHAAYAGIGLQLNEEEAYNFNIKLTDEESGKALNGGVYDVTIDDGTTVRKVSGRATNSDGILSTRLVSSDNITIKVNQIKSKLGYVVDTTEQVIKLQKEDGVYKVISQSPYDYSDGKNGTEVNGNNIIFHHTNEKKNNDSVKLNLYINEMDKNDNRLANVPVRVSSDTLKNSEGRLLDEQLETDGNGYIELEKIKVTNIEIPKDSEHILNIVETDAEGNPKENTRIKLKLTFRYNEGKATVELTNAESTWGNRLIKSKTFNGYETDEAYESNLYLDIYGNYDDVGNFSLDLRKLNEEGNILDGAKYDVVVTRPDGTKIIKRDLEITDKVEFEGFLASKGTVIEITEKEAPLGYKVNEYTETLRISEVSEDGSVSVDLEDAGYAVSRASIKDIQNTKLSDGTMKTFVTLDLIDQNLNTFKLGITTKDSVSSKGVSDFKYYLYTNKGAQVESGETNSEGKVTTLVGASYAGQTVQYTIKELETAKYYKGLKTIVTLNIVYSEDGTVDAIETLAAQTDPNYKTKWDILATNTESGNDIDIVIYNDPQDSFKVQLETVDRVTGQKVDNIEYQVRPSINLEGKGTTDIDVGYVVPSSLEVYTLRQLTTLDNYKTIDTQTFRLLYNKDGEIQEVSNLSKDLELVEKEGRTVKFKVYVEPKVPITIKAVGYFDNKELEGTEYTISGRETKTITTNAEGVAVDYNGILGTNEEITYTITENKITSGYVKLNTFRIKVHYNANREIDNVSLVGADNRWVSLGYKTPSESTDVGYNGNDKGIVQITLKHYPEFLINITNKDRLDNSINLAGTQYEVTSSINTNDNGVLTNSDGVGVAKLGQTLISDKIVYTIEEKRAASLYQTIEKPVKVEVSFDENGYVKEANVIDGADFATASKIENITNPRDNFAINVEIRNCKMLKFNITAVDSQDETYALRGLTFTAQSELDETSLSSSSVQTDVNGQGTLGLDKDYANQTIKYTIRETRKVSGYQFPSEDLIIEVTFDSQGKIIKDSVKMLQGAGYTEITNIDPDGFNIDLKILNTETEDFGLNIMAVDKYDDSIKIKDVNYETYMMTSDYAKDDNYTGNTTTDEYGEGYVQYGKYVSSNPNGSETRQIRIKETNLSDKYRAIRAEIVVNVTFDANGLVNGVSIPGGYNTYLGWVADTRFVSVTHTRHTVSVTIKHYPYLFMNVKAEDMYTGEALSGRYKISTTRGPGYSNVDVSKVPMQNRIQKVQEDIYKSESRGATLTDLVTALSKDTSIDRINVSSDGESATFVIGQITYTVNSILEVVKAQTPGSYSGTTGLTNIDYVGNGYGEILTQNYTTNTNGDWAKAGIGPTETSSETRTYYIYEEQAPSSPIQYQQYRPRQLSWEYSKIIATITVKYNNRGRIEKYTIDEERSNNNIKKFLDVKIIDGTNLGITIKYAPITTMEVTTIDNVSRSGIPNIRISPYSGSDYGTRQSYEYRNDGYYTTSSQGETNYTYWGGNVKGSQNEYVINTSLMGNKGYFETEPVRVKVAYDDKGRISAATVLSTDTTGKANAEVVSFENNNLKIKIIFNRKLNFVIEKQDEYDSNEKITAQFDIKSNKDENETITSDKLTTVGIAKSGEKVEYSLSETTVPNGYIPLDNLKFTVTYNKDGTIKNVKSDNKLFEMVSKRESADAVRTTEVEDLRIRIKNEPKFAIKLNVMDKYYNSKKLSDVTFSITNDKGDVATGNPVTDQNGRLTAYISKAYKNETVRYTINQTSTPSGYNEYKTPIVIDVKFNENGKIKEYTVISGNDISKVDETKYQNERYLEVDVLGNIPKNINIGIKNYDNITNEGISGITFKMSSQEIVGGSAIKEKSIVTNEDGTVIDTMDNFKATNGIQRVVNYTISQINIPNSYRRIQDVVFQIRYNEDGSIASRNVLSNPSNINVEVALGGSLKYLGNTPVHILLSIPNDNAYDINIKDEDRNYEGLGIEGTTYDVSINGKQEITTTNEEGIANIINRKEVGTITIQIGENTIGTGYRKDSNNATTIVLEKGEVDYSLKLISNSNPSYAEVEVNEEYGTVNIGFKNETSSSITLVKDEKEVRYKITSAEVDGENNSSNEKVIGTDVSDENGQEKLKYDLGVTPQNKKVVYTFEQVNYPVDYYKIGTFTITVEYGIYGNITKITSNSNRVSAIEDPENSHDIVAIVSEYVPDKTQNDDENDTDSSITIIKDNENVKYEVGYKEVNAEGTESNAKTIGTEATEVLAKEQAYFEVGKLPSNKTIVFTIRELSIPEGYSSIGIVEVIVKTNKDGLIYYIEKNSEKVSAKLTPEGSNDIVVTVGSEEGSLTLTKDNKKSKYKITSKEENSDGTTSNEKVEFEETETDADREKIHVSIRDKVIDKTIVYTFVETKTPEGSETKEKFEIKIVYDSNGHITDIINNYNYVKAEEKPAGSGDIYVSFKDDTSNEESSEGSITIVKDNKNVKYQVLTKETDSDGNTSNSKLIGDESIDGIEPKEQLYCEFGKLSNDSTETFTIKEFSTPEGYESNGTIEITAKTNSNGIIEGEIVSNTEKAKARLIPTGSNDIVVVIGDEYASLTLTKSNEKVRYQITSEEEDESGKISNKKIILDEEDANITRRKSYISFKEKIENKKIVYTFKEKNKPDGYDTREDFKVEVVYGEDGKITSITNNNYFVKAKAIPEGSNDLFVTVMLDDKLEEESDAYTIKVVSQEVDSNLRINDSTFDIDVTQGEGNLIATMKDAKTANIEKKGYILEKGVIKTEDIKKRGEIDVNINQTGVAEGYKLGDEITSGTVKLDVSYVEPEEGEKYQPRFNVLDNAGFDISIDNTNRVVTIKVKNVPEINMGITNILRTKDEEDNIVETPLNSSKFTITSQIQTKTDITDTDLNVTTPMTDENGFTEVKAGRPYVGKTVLYTIRQTEREEYTPLEDIVVLVQYDTKGNIKYYEVISNPDDAKVTGEIGTRNLKVNVVNTLNNKKYGYKIVLEKHHINDTDYGELIPGAKFKIEVEQEYGEYNTTWESVTDAEGLITSDLFDGYGNINIKITELNAPEGYASQGETQEIRLNRNRTTGKLTIISSDVGYEFSEDYSVIYLKPVNEPLEQLYTIIINKSDSKTGKMITESQAQFDVKMIEQENVGTEEEPEMKDVETYIGQFETDNKGKAKIENLQKPEKPGTYKYEITEIKAPDGYVKLEEPVILQVEFEENNGKIVMKDNPTILSGDASIKSKNKDLLNITINNVNEKDLNKYTLDITKKDAETGEAIENMALFKVWLPDSENTALYAETMNNDYGKGKLDYCYIEQDKDYSTRLTSMQVPTEEGTLKYVFREAAAPEGYTKVDEDLELDIEFKKEESTGKMYISNITSSNEDYLKINTPTPCNTDTVISVDILNNKDKGEQYTIHYDANDNGEGTTVPADQIKEKDIDIILSTEEPTREGYTFKGWTTVADSKTVQYKPGDAYKANSDVTLYAVWEQPLYIKSNQYVISNEDNYVDDAKLEENVYDVSDKYILGILPKLTIEDESKENENTKGTKLEDFKNSIDTNADDIRVYDKDENDITDRVTYIGTGMIVEFQKENETPIRLTIIARGDLNGDGILNLSDITKAKRYIKKDELSILDTTIKKLAFDTNFDGKLNMRDANNMQRAQSNDDIRKLNN